MWIVILESTFRGHLVRYIYNARYSSMTARAGSGFMHDRISRQGYRLALLMRPLIRPTWKECLPTSGFCSACQNASSGASRIALSKGFLNDLGSFPPTNAFNFDPVTLFAGVGTERKATNTSKRAQMAPKNKRLEGCNSLPEWTSHKSPN